MLRATNLVQKADLRGRTPSDSITLDRATALAVDFCGTFIGARPEVTIEGVAKLVPGLGVGPITGLGELDVVKSWFDADGSLKRGAGALADPYGQELKQRGQSPFRCERTRPNIVSQALCFACVHNRLAVADFLLAQGADINAIVPGLDMKATVLHRVATANGHFTRSEIETAIRFLLDRGADPAIRDEMYHSPISRLTMAIMVTSRMTRFWRACSRANDSGRKSMSFTRHLAGRRGLRP